MCLLSSGTDFLEDEFVDAWNRWESFMKWSFPLLPFFIILISAQLCPSTDLKAEQLLPFPCLLLLGFFDSILFSYLSFL